jgi:hypothetical protein
VHAAELLVRLSGLLGTIDARSKGMVSASRERTGLGNQGNGGDNGARESFARRIYLKPQALRPTAAEVRAVQTLALTLAPYADHIRRVSVRIARTTGRAVAFDHVCRVHVALRDVYDVPSFLVEGEGSSDREAAQLAAEAARRVVLLALGGEVATQARSNESIEEEARTRAAETARRHHTTPREVKSAKPLRGRHIHKTQRQARATSARELSKGRPSRKSTRRSSNRSKRESNQVLRHERAIRAPKERAARAF